MLQKWKRIINNWINCYCDETTRDRLSVDIDSLLTIISHLRENLNLDESKSSVLEAHTVEEFILEKYPGFKFKTGTVNASNEDDVYLVASLLLYFVCVNSKNVDIKSAMCSKLNADDQETIMRFSKTLMECSHVTCEDIQLAITEACGEDMAIVDTGHVKVAVAETPPALRSLHSEVRRLQAALDAERFDRNFLQEELARTSLRLEKLMKDKEQYKSDIMDLKTKISLCCRGDHDAHQMDNEEKHTARLTRQLQDLEERLVRAQDQLEETGYEKDILKSKLEGLKEDRDKWLTLSQQESARATQLAEYLEAEKRQMQSLRELITELRQHNRLNRMDSSQLECDDPDASIQSLGHNLSVCSEACANVIEVQLSEERSKVDALKYEIEILQKENEQLHFAIEEDNSNHEIVLKEKDAIIDNLEQQFKEQSFLLESLRKDHEEIILSQEQHKLKSREIIEDKDDRIRKLNDHLASLKQEYADLKSVNEDLNKKIDDILIETTDTEKAYRDQIENLALKLTQEQAKNDIITNEMKVLHNQLIGVTSYKEELELVKSKLEKEYDTLIANNKVYSEEKMILAHQLAEEKSLRQILEEEKKALSTQNTANEKKYTKQIKHIEKKLSKEVTHTRTLVQDKECLTQQLIELKCAKELAEKEKETLILEKSVLEQNISDIITVKTELGEQINQLINKLSSLEEQCSTEKIKTEDLTYEKNILIKTLEEEKLCKEELQKENKNLTTENNRLKNDVLEQKSAQTVLLNDLQLLMLEKEEFVKSLELDKSARDELENEKHCLSLQLKEVNEQYTSELQAKQLELYNIMEGMKRLQQKYEVQRESYKELSLVLNVGVDKLLTNLTQDKCTWNILQTIINGDVKTSIMEKCDLLLNIANTLNTVVVTKMKTLQSNNVALKSLKEVCKQKEEDIIELQTEIKQLKHIVLETNNELSDQNETYTNTLNTKLKEMQQLQQENQTLTNELNTLKIQLETKVHYLKEKLVDRENETDELKKGYECQIDNLNIMVNNVTQYLKEKTTEMDVASEEIVRLKAVVEENNKVIKCLEEELKLKAIDLERVTNDFESEKLVLKNMVTVTESVMEDQKVSLNETIAKLIDDNRLLQDENANIKEQFLTKRTELELMIQKKEYALQDKYKELIALQQVKEGIEKEQTLEQEKSTKEIASMKKEIQKKVTEIVTLKEDLNEMKFRNSVLGEEIVLLKADMDRTLLEMGDLENVIRNFKEDVTVLQNQNTELNNKIQLLTETLQEEIGNKNDFNMKLNEKSNIVSAMENKIALLEKQLNDLEQDTLEEKHTYLAKIQEVETELQITNTKLDEEERKYKMYLAALELDCSELKKNKKELNDQFNKYKKKADTDIEKLKQEKAELQKYNTGLEEIVVSLKNANIQSEQITNRLKKDNSVLKEDVHKYKEHNSKLKNELEELFDTFMKEKAENDEQNLKMATTLHMCVAKVIQDLKTEGITSETLQQLIDIEKDDASVLDKCNMLINIANMLTTEAVLRKNLEKALEHEDITLADMKEVLNQKESQITELEKELKQVVERNNIVIDNKVKEMQLLQQENTSLTNDLNDVKVQLELKVHSLKEKLVDSENLTDKLKNSYECQIDNLNVMIAKLTNYLKDKSLELEVLRKEKDRLQQVVEDNHRAIKSLEEENRSEKLRQEKLINDFESERKVIKNMVAVTETVMEDQKLAFDSTVAEKDKNMEKLQDEIKSINNEKKDLEHKLKEKDDAIELVQKELVDLRLVKNTLETEIKLQKEISLKEVTVMKNEITKKVDEIMKLEDEIKQLGIINNNYKDSADSLVNQNSELKMKKDAMKVEFRDKIKKLTESQQEQIEIKKDLNIELVEKSGAISTLESRIKDLENKINVLEEDKSILSVERDGYAAKVNEMVNKFESDTTNATTRISELQDKMNTLEKKIKVLEQDNSKLIMENDGYETKLNQMQVALETTSAKAKEEMDSIKNMYKNADEELVKRQTNITELKEDHAKLLETHAQLLEENNKLKTENLKLTEDVTKLKNNNTELLDVVNENKAGIVKLEEAFKLEQEQYNKIQNEKMSVTNKCDILQDYHTKAEQELADRQTDIVTLQKQIQTLQAKVELCVTESIAKDGHISKMSKEKDSIIDNVNKELLEEKVLRAKYQKDLEEKIATISELKKTINELSNEREALKILRKENEELIKAIGQRETFAVRSHESASSRKYSGQLAEKELRDIHHQVDNTSDITHSSIESLKTITDLEKIIHDKNRTITTLQSDITYIKTLMAESENKLLDVTKDLDLSKENCHQLSSQLKKIVHQKNEEIAELKQLVNKMSATENRATQIIKVSAKYQAIILRRIAEIKSNTVLKELTNFGNSNNCDSELRRSLTAGSITMEDLENFLETTERHLKKCSDKQTSLQKEKDRLTEVNRINESEIINLNKFLTELSVSFQTFSTIKDVYANKLSRIISMQRTVRREILNLDGHITDTCMLKLERGYAAVMQDLAECAMNLERWVERCIGRTISSEKLKQAFLNDNERTSLAPSTLQNVGLEVQLNELEVSFQKLLEEAYRAPKGEGAKDAKDVTLMEVRAEYEDKLNRMKAKMKQLYTEQIAVFKEKQREEISKLEHELARAKDTLSKSSRAYEDHIRGLTTELWSVGEKFLMQKDEAKYLRRKQQSGSLMSLQHVHSSGLVPPTQDESVRSADTQSLRSLPTTNNGAGKREGRGLHMSDEEGELFDNRYLQELSTPSRGRPSAVIGPHGAPPERLSELRWRNSLCPPHLKSSYPAETQFANTIDEEEIKAMGGAGVVAGATGTRSQRKEVGIIAYKKPGPPTPSKQAGRLSATDSELRESLRVEADPQPSRKTSTPSRIRSLFRSSNKDTTDGTPRSRRLSSIFRKK